MSEVKTHYRTCNICEAMCGLEIRHRDEQILSIKGDPEDPLSKGHICPKGVALQDFYADKERLKTPLRRTADGWEELTWEQAITEVAQRLRDIQSEHGVNSVGAYLGNPNAHNLGSALFLPRFFKALGSNNRYSSASADQLPHHVASNYMLGAGMVIPIPDIDRTDFMLIIGGNPIVSNGSMMTAPGVGKRIKAIQARGGKVVVIDPRRTETAKKADEHYFIRPEADALLLAAMVYSVFDGGNVRLRHLQDQVHDLDKVEAAVRAFSPEDVAPRIGIDAATIRNLVARMLAADSAVCYSRMGASTQSFGGLCQWLTNVFNIITGNFDREGGAMFPQPAFDLLGGSSRGKRSSYGRYQSRVRGLPFYNGEFPVATLADEILTDGEGQIRAMVTVAGNPVLSSPGGDRLTEAFASLDFMVSLDIYINETTKHADIILPAATGLEIPQFDVFFNTFSVRNTVKYSEPMFPRGENQREDWEILKALAMALTGAEDDGSSPEKILDMGLQNGTYGEQGMSLETLRQQPRGIDLGPLKPCLEQRILTDDGKIRLAPQLYLDDIPRLERDAFENDAETEFPLRLISRRLARSHNTWTQNSHRLVKGCNPVTAQISPADAGRLGIENGQTVTVRSATGTIAIEAEICDDLFEGVISIPHGWGHNHKDTQMTIAAGQPGVSINSLTDSNRIDPLTGNAAFNGTPVAISA